jgi:hypothetical protein
MSTSLESDHHLRGPASSEGHAAGESRMKALFQAEYGSPEVLELRRSTGRWFTMVRCSSGSTPPALTRGSGI